MQLEDKINGKNLQSVFRLIIQTGTEELLEYPERKESLTNDWADENSKEYDLETPKFYDKEVTLNCCFFVDNDTQFWNVYNAFFAELKKKGYQQLFVYDHSRTYEVFYKKTGNFNKATKRLKNTEVVLVNFDLILQVK